MIQTTVSVPTRALVMGMLHDDGTIRSGELYEVAEACGQSSDQLRSCLRRLVADGLLSRSGGRGKTAVFRATPAAISAIKATVEPTRLGYVQTMAGRGWDGRFYLVAFAVPERTRSARDGFRDRLLTLGGASIQGGLYVSPHQWHKDVRVAAEHFAIRDSVTLGSTGDLEVGGERYPRPLARRLWPLDAIAARYRAFIERHEATLLALEESHTGRQRRHATGSLPGALAAGVDFAEVFNDDPFLPPDLLPDDWPGHAAHDLALRSRRLAHTLLRAAPRS